jgi:hypothetical protein
MKDVGKISIAWRALLFALFVSTVACVEASAAEGVKFVGRWAGSADAPVATYGGSTVLLSFARSSRVTADLTVAGTVTWVPAAKLYIAVSIDGGAPRRMGLDRGSNRAVVLASGLSPGAHVVAVRDDGEPYFGSLQFANPTLEAGGTWVKISSDRPIIEIIGDSDATGICVLGPQSPALPALLFTSAWASQTLSWPGLLEASLAALGHPADVVDLAISGSNTTTEAATYDQAAPFYNKSAFVEYAGHRHTSLAILWGGVNDHKHGGDLATGSPVAYTNLSPFERGIYDQMTKIFARNPEARIVLLDYIDPAVPDWEPAYAQVKNLFSATQQKQMYSLAVNDPPKVSDACDIDPSGHPNLSMHATWAAQILRWMMANALVP